MNIYHHTYGDQYFFEYSGSNYDFYGVSTEEIINRYQNRCNQLENKLLKEYLKIYKPHFQLYYEFIENQEEIKINRQIGSNHIILEVFDSFENIKKQLVIFDNKKENIIDYYIELFQRFPRKDLILNLYDSYYLDDKKTFYVFEQEVSANSLIYFHNDLKQNIISKLQAFFCEFFQDLNNEQIMNSIQNQISLKVDLFCFQNEVSRVFNKHKIIQQDFVLFYSISQ
ncbi:hypothetical protein TTHERM_001462173 (macronuclear) [Tetrahymena thermophila SB210]|uniref:Uncharacterized protein n=1 Tax=Tetrahymena thermophila (strain SB210) TaxID=312017 RepID=W7XCQ3_TETTS|nr:hypothetical protein TTHERM_001462173 [Tetrahymena thermophila SB210]EWS71571.1 hypothetical protein TTHERM_001462173 [Tetrahymena thermophila SB210]|eukprot:XP_012655893.1 hypothetical protein TTHERM_001462173 [Tetrahymena thermophila SB210]